MDKKDSCGKRDFEMNKVFNEEKSFMMMMDF